MNLLRTCPDLIFFGKSPGLKLGRWSRDWFLMIPGWTGEGNWEYF
jgi:hypothetical protein